MNCPSCKTAENYVIDSRDIDSSAIRRRRECIKCHYRFTTYERLEPIKLHVLKKDGTVENYSRTKLISGIKLATEKRGITETQIESLVDAVEQELLQADQSAVPSAKIGKTALKYLKDLDDVAYLRFSSVYKKFSSLKSFEKELARLEKTKTS